jgi:small-conductance mechanosensitive channel
VTVERGAAAVSLVQEIATRLATTTDSLSSNWAVYAPPGEAGWRSLPERLITSIPIRETVYSLAILGAGLLVGWFAATLSLRALARWAKRTDNILDDAVVRHLRVPLQRLAPVVATMLLLPLLRLPQQFKDVAQHALLVLVVVATGWTAFRAVRVIEELVVHRHSIDTADNLSARALQTQVGAFRNIAGFVIVVVTLAFVLLTFERVRQLGAGLLASAGIAGIVLGFAAQRGIATVLAGIQIAISQPIRVDDVVIIEGEWGRIEEINLTYVVVRIWDLRRLIVPVTHFLDKPFQNWTRVSADILGTVELHVDFSVPVDEVRAEFKRLLDESKLWDGKVWGLQVTDSSETTMTLRPLMGARNASDAWDLRCHVREKLIEYLRTRYPGALPKVRAEVQRSPDEDGTPGSEPQK